MGTFIYSNAYFTIEYSFIYALSLLFIGTLLSLPIMMTSGVPPSLSFHSSSPTSHSSKPPSNKLFLPASSPVSILYIPHDSLPSSLIISALSLPILKKSWTVQTPPSPPTRTCIPSSVRFASATAPPSHSTPPPRCSSRSRAFYRPYWSSTRTTISCACTPRSPKFIPRKSSRN